MGLHEQESFIVSTSIVFPKNKQQTINSLISAADFSLRTAPLSRLILAFVLVA